MMVDKARAPTVQCKDATWVEEEGTQHAGWHCIGGVFRLSSFARRY
jgi:hypothetical protein